jgi:hemerythrin-like domain-containing protein
MNAPDLTGYHVIHAGLRQAAHRLAAGAVALDPADAKRLKAFRKYWAGYTGEVLGHHTVEDDFFFPALAEKVPVARDYMARLASEHDQLDELMTATASAIDGVANRCSNAVVAASVLRDLAHHMDQHLDFEDADVLPLFERHFSVEEYDGLNQKAMKSLGIGRQAAFTVPFVATSAGPEDRALLLADAPAALRVVYRLTRGRYERLAAAAFGPAADVVEVP